ncbi:MAG TPA: DUF4147 domain-containing protein, partial [bacterium]|nr:DUF4147 domain-containing protein [bacterium]
MQKKLRAHLKKIYKYSLSATAAEKIVTENVIYDFSKNLLKIQGKKYNLSKYKNIYIVGFGKASAALGLAIEKILKAKITDGIIITKYGHSQKLEKIKVCEADHPLPNENNIKYTKELLALVDKANSDDLVIVLISG